MKTKQEIKEATEKAMEVIFSGDYVNTLPEELTEKCKDKLLHFLVDGIDDASGAYYPFMTEVCSALKPKHVVELGNREGLGTVSIMHGLKDNDEVLFTTIDTVNDLRIVPASIKNSPKLNFIQRDVLTRYTINLVKQKPPIDIILLDTIHTEKQLASEWDLYEPLLSDNALVMVDDVNLKSKHKFFNKIEHEKFIDKRLHQSGFGIVYYERNP